MFNAFLSLLFPFLQNHTKALQSAKKDPYSLQIIDSEVCIQSSHWKSVLFESRPIPCWRILCKKHMLWPKRSEINVVIYIFHKFFQSVSICSPFSIGHDGLSSWFQNSTYQTMSALCDQNTFAMSRTYFFTLVLLQWDTLYEFCSFQEYQDGWNA